MRCRVSSLHVGRPATVAKEAAAQKAAADKAAAEAKARGCSRGEREDRHMQRRSFCLIAQARAAEEAKAAKEAAAQKAAADKAAAAEAKARGCSRGER